MLQTSTIQLLRFHFSYFLMPVYWFALSFVSHIDWGRAILIFVLIHFLLYPASNGYNSYMDRDDSPIGGLPSPMQPTRQLFVVTIIMDLCLLILSFLISYWFLLAVAIYILCSRLYSYRGIRLKRFPVIGYITVILNQGAIVFFMVYHGTDKNLTLEPPWQGLAAATFLIGGFYPITQVYQHEQDAADGVNTISMKLGKKGTFIFCASMYIVAFSILLQYFLQKDDWQSFLLLQIFFLPVIIYFFRWAIQVWHNDSAADFKRTMQMNWLASTCTGMAFIILLIKNQIG